MAQQVTVSSKFQVVIPEAVRKQVPIRAGQRMVVQVRHGLITLVPVLSIEELQGMLQGVNTEGLREEEDRF
ncbi:MAG TPA: AbrB/MazE/SpoVT family DNA-binding domain-containing protein [Armatimonadota bacterium]|jgi:AbrB family looped-hinge helix DNA binding protein